MCTTAEAAAAPAVSYKVVQRVGLAPARQVSPMCLSSPLKLEVFGHEGIPPFTVKTRKSSRFDDLSNFLKPWSICLLSLDMEFRSHGLSN